MKGDPDNMLFGSEQEDTCKCIIMQNIHWPRFEPLQSLKGNATNCTHESVFTDLGEYYCVCGKGRMKSFEAPEEAAHILISGLQRCHSVELHCG